MYIDPLIQKGYEVLAFDAPAHGRSEGKQINAIIYRDFIKEVCSTYGPIQSFLSHSFGGLALCLAIEEMQHDESCRLVLIAPATQTDTAVRHFFKFINVNNKEVKQEFEKIIIAIGGHPLSWFSVPRTLPFIKGKILWIHDETDQVTPLKDVLKVDRSQFPTVQFMITKGLGHRRIYRDPEVGKTIAKFL
jgi:pimeloyl-ACP methyl ester carboxylesterase